MASIWDQLAAIFGRSKAPAQSAAFFDDFNGPAGTLPSWLRPERAVPGGHDLQAFTDYPRNAFLDGHGNLLLRAIREPVPGYPVSFTSARLSSAGLFDRRFGRWEARMRLPKGLALHPAFWLLGNNFTGRNWPACGEIDVFEGVDTIWGSGVHGTKADAAVRTKLTDFTGWHTYWLDWSKDRIVCGIDDTTTATWTPKSFKGKWPFNERAMYVIFCLRVDTELNQPATLLAAADMVVDWFRWTPA